MAKLVFKFIIVTLVASLFIFLFKLSQIYFSEQRLNHQIQFILKNRGELINSCKFNLNSNFAKSGTSIFFSEYKKNIDIPLALHPSGCAVIATINEPFRETKSVFYVLQEDIILYDSNESKLYFKDKVADLLKKDFPIYNTYKVQLPLNLILIKVS